MADEENKQEIDSNIIVSALKFWQKIFEEKDVVIKFIKKDGTERIMRVTLDFSKIPEKDKPKTVNIQQILKLIQKNKIMHVYDLEKKGWRSVPFETVQYMDTKDKKRYYTKTYYDKHFNKGEMK
jgi:hypothetical protein